MPTVEVSSETRSYAASPTTSTPGWRAVAAALGMGALGFGIVAGLLHLGLRDPLHLHADIRSEKLFLLNQWSGKAYSASFGSSHAHNGFDPRTFDAVMAGSSAQTRTVNLAIAGGSQSEQRATALEFVSYLQAPDSARAAAGPQACMVLLELAAGANFTNDHLVHPRAINIYDWATTRFVLHLTSSSMGLKQRAGRAGYAVAAMALHYMNLGMLSSRIFPAPLDPEMLHDETVDDRRGLLVMRNQNPALQKITAMIAAAPKQPKVTAGMIFPGNAELLEQLNSASRLHPLQFVYFVMPKIGDLWQEVDYPNSIATAQGPMPIVNLAQPRRYPQIYDARLWYDDAHLNERGAQLVTRLLAEELKNWYAAHGQPAGCER